jgi:predicted ATP-grasp superfamily ATP-dependent carboligase
VCIPFASSDEFRRICDKDAVLDAARGLGIAIPLNRKLVHPAAIADLALGAADFPMVVKPARSVSDAAGARIRSGARHVADRGALDAVLSSYKPESYPLLLQRRIEGPSVGIFLLMWDGERVATFAHRRIREKPPSGGVSVYRESIPAASDLVERSVRLLREFKWQGVAMVEYKVDRHDGTPYLMEINGRFWGSLQLAIDAGVDFPALLLAAARGQSVDPVVRYRSGLRSRWWWGDVDHLVARLRYTDEQLALPPDAPARWRALVEFLKIWRPGDRTEILRVSDPLPFLRETIDWFRGNGL